MTNSISVANLSVTFDYETVIATVTGNLVASGDGPAEEHELADSVEIFPRFSSDQLTWESCVLAAALPSGGFAASPGGEPFSFEWDFRDALPSTGEPVSLYLTVMGYFPGVGEVIPEHFGRPPEEDAISISIGPEQAETTSVPLDPDLSVVEATELLQYDLLDRDSEDVNVTVEYSTNGGSTWSECTEGVGGDGTINLATSPGGVSHIFAWDTLADGVRGTRVLIRISPYKQSRPSPKVYADVRFSDRVIAAYTFAEDAAPVAVVAGDAYPSMLRGTSRGNRQADFDGSVSLDASSRLAFTCDVDERASIGFPQNGISPSVERALMLDAEFDIGTAQSLTIEIVALGNKVLAKITFSTLSGVLLEVSVGAASYVLESAAEVYAASTTYNARVTLNPNDEQTTISYVRDGTPVAFDLGAAPDLVISKLAKIFSCDGVYFRVSAEGAVGTSAYLHRLVLMDDDQFTGAHVVPTSADPREYDWLGDDWWPRSQNGVFVGNSSAPGDYSSKPGQHGQAVALLGSMEFPNILAGKRRKLRPDLFSHGFGVEFHCKVPVGYALFSLVDDSAACLELELGDNLGVAARVVDETDVTTELVFENEGASFEPLPSLWHHVRFSVRRFGPSYLVALSVNGSRPSYTRMAELPKLFNPSADVPTGYRLLVELMDFSGVDPVLVDDLKVWDGYHMSPYPIPVPEAPQTEYWKP